MAERNTVPNLEAKTTDGNPVFTPRHWLERFRQFCKREHKIDITPLMKREEIINWAGIKTSNTRRFHMGCGTGSILSNNQGRIKNGTRQHQNTGFDSVIHRVLHAETEYLP